MDAVDAVDSVDSVEKGSWLLGHSWTEGPASSGQSRPDHAENCVGLEAIVASNSNHGIWLKAFYPSASVFPGQPRFECPCTVFYE